MSIYSSTQALNLSPFPEIQPQIKSATISILHSICSSQSSFLLISFDISFGNSLYPSRISIFASSEATRASAS